MLVDSYNVPGDTMLSIYTHTFLKFFFLLTPFFLLSSFLSMTRQMDTGRRKRTAVKVTFSLIIIAIILILIGNQIFNIFGITLNSFRIGTGILLFLSAKSLVQGSDTVEAQNDNKDIAVVPLAIPIGIGPATTGALLVMGSELPDLHLKLIGIGAIVTAIIVVGFLLYIGGYIEKLVKRQGLEIMSKVTGLILAAMASELVMNGIKGFLN